MTAQSQTVTRFAVSAVDSSLSIDARSTLHAVHATASGLTGYLIAAQNSDGTLASAPAPILHVEFPIDSVRSGNALQDREMRRLVDAGRFPKVTGDLRSVDSIAPPNRYRAGGDITLVGRTRTYGAEFTMTSDGESITVEGELAVDIRDFGLKPPSLLILKVDPILRVSLRLVARKGA
jgi:polyisoprenoid-binding protein YceI